jgi:hypothetical protein
MCGISCHKNTKFLHAITEVCLYHMHRKWNSYVYFEPDSTIGNFEVRITTFIITTHPPQFTHYADIRFLWHCLWNSVVTVTSSNSVLSDTSKHCPVQSLASHFLQYVVVHCFIVFPVWLLVLCTHNAQRFSLQSSRCHWNSMYKPFSPF